MEVSVWLVPEAKAKQVVTCKRIRRRYGEVVVEGFFEAGDLEELERVLAEVRRWLRVWEAEDGEDPR